MHFGSTTSCRSRFRSTPARRAARRRGSRNLIPARITTSQATRRSSLSLIAPSRSLEEFLGQRCLVFLVRVVPAVELNLDREDTPLLVWSAAWKEERILFIATLVEDRR